MAKQKYYAVARGRQVGVFTDWPTTEKLVRGYTGARYKSFLDKASAEAFVKDPSNTTPKAHHHSKANTDTPVDLKAAKAIFYTDGGSRNTGNVAGGHVKSNDKAAWAYLIKYQGQELSDSAGEFGATNNRMEITALRNALQRLLDLGLAQELLVGVLDSKYVLDSINLGWLAGWQRRGFKKADGTTPQNVALWQDMAALLPQFKNLKLIWTKGHADNSGNVYVDQLLNQTMDNM
ncbi:MAG: ribonuclease H family protein [Lactobacillus sp.]|nr:ribonuclease H family protein [Lactobacillus sp.]